MAPEVVSPLVDEELAPAAAAVASNNTKALRTLGIAEAEAREKPVLETLPSPPVSCLVSLPKFTFSEESLYLTELYTNIIAIGRQIEHPDRRVYAKSLHLFFQHQREPSPGRSWNYQYLEPKLEPSFRRRYEQAPRGQPRSHFAHQKTASTFEHQKKLLGWSYEPYEKGRNSAKYTYLSPASSFWRQDGRSNGVDSRTGRKEQWQR